MRISTLALVATLLAACSSNKAVPGDSSTPDRRVDVVTADRPPPIEARADQVVAGERVGSPDRPPQVDQRVVDRPMGLDGGTVCKPYCGAIGTKSEGWFDGCTKTWLQKPGTGGTFWDQCAACDSECALGSQGLGWYKVCEKSKLLRWQLCSSKTDAGTACKPYCGAIGSKSEGWYDGCTKQLMNDPTSGTPMWAQCSTCSVACMAIGSFSEGWYAECPGDLLLLGKCTP
jgi:hypothetical protein